MSIEEIVKFMKKRPYTRKQGSVTIADRTKSSLENVKAARAILNSQNINKYQDSIPKILIFDIETSPLRAYVWKLWKNNVNLDHILSEWFCLAWSAKWLYSNEIITGVLTPKESLEEDDSRIMKKLWSLVNRADIFEFLNKF